MTSPNPGIFRQEALDYRLRNRGRRSAQVTFPRLMASPVRVALWLALAVIAIAALLACFWTVPVNAGGMAIVTPQTWSASGGPVVAVLMQADEAEELEPGRRANVRLGVNERSLPGAIVSVEQGLLTPAAASERLGLPQSALSMLGGDVTLTWVRLDGASRSDFGNDNFGRADVETGTAPAGSFLPLVDRFFKE